MWAILNPEIQHICLNKMYWLSLSGLRTKSTQVVIILFIADIDINSINPLVNCYFHHYDETNISLRKRVDLSHSNISSNMKYLNYAEVRYFPAVLPKKTLKTGIFIAIFLRKLNTYHSAKNIFYLYKGDLRMKWAFNSRILSWLHSRVTREWYFAIIPGHIWKHSVNCRVL